MIEWRTAEGYSRYKVSTDGRVFDTETERELPQTWNGNFLCSNLIGDGGKKALCKIHRLVAIAFIENAENAHNVIHKDEDRSNNTVGNLLWKAKRVKEESVKEVKTIEFLGKAYTYPDFCVEAGCSLTKLRARLKAEWSVRECFTGIKEFQGAGYQDNTHWYPKEDLYKSALRVSRIQEKKALKDERNVENALRRAEAKAQSHYGFGIFVNYPIKGIVGREALRSYRVWDGMIARCYNTKHDSFNIYGGRGCTVSEEWRYYQNFAAWYDTQLGTLNRTWQVDKDILVEGNLEYGPDTCVYVPHDINTFFCSTKDHINGYGFDKGLYKAGLLIGGVKSQRSFKTELEASDWYKSGKTLAAQILLWKYEGLLDQRVVDKLMKI